MRRVKEHMPMIQALAWCQVHNCTVNFSQKGVNVTSFCFPEKLQRFTADNFTEAVWKARNSHGNCKRD
jgi:hypothetical protein